MRAARDAVERAVLNGLGALGPEELAAARQALGEAPSAPAGEETPATAHDATRLLLALCGRVRREVQPPELPAQDTDATTTLERLDAALVGTMDDERLAAAEREALRRHPARAAEQRVAGLREPRDLLRLVTGGSTWERRAAVLRLEEFLRGDGRGFAAADRKATAEALELEREGALAREIDLVLAAVSGAPGGRARARVARAQKLLERLEKDVRRFWDGDLPEDPVVALDDEALATLGTFAADAPDVVVGHLGETLRRLTAERDATTLERVVSALALGADERLVPSLLRVLQDAEVPARVHAARSLARVDDPRVPAALRKAYRHAGTPDEQVALAGALAAHGDRRGAGAVLDHLGADQPPHVLELALEALVATGEPANVGRVIPFLKQGRVSTARAAAAALGAFGDGAALEALEQAGSRAELRPQAERSLAQVRARLDLAGALPPSAVPRPAKGDTPRPARTRLAARAVGRLYYALGLLWLGTGRRVAALGAFELAVAQHPYLLGPRLARARILLRRKELEGAVESLRGAIRVRAATVLQLPDRANFVIRAYLRYADSCTASGRHLRALEALDELLGYDLRFADVDLRLEAQRRREFVARDQRREE
ncbi:MAG: hypothetical protein JXB32_14920 [Deltaproteobacteria bacterium]|nr:hypothetical protein [Deltaproteobacteria bacterium]